MTTLPLNWSELTSRPSISFNFQDGAIAATASGLVVATGSAAKTIAPAVSKAATPNAERIRNEFMLPFRGAGLRSCSRKVRRSARDLLDVKNLDEFLHRRSEHAAFAVQDGERPGEFLALESDGGERALFYLLDDGRLRHDRDAMVDLDRPLHRLDVVELHHRRDLELIVAEDLVDRLPGRDIGVKPDELVAGERFDVHV